NGRQILEVTGLDRFVQYRVDGVTMREEQLPGKPAPDSFLRAAELLQVPPQHGAVFEDALSGVAAGRAGGFGLVVGVDRVGQAEALRRNGADIVVTDLAELLTPGARPRTSSQSSPGGSARPGWISNCSTKPNRCSP